MLDVLPRPFVTGKRYVPRIVSASGMPMLRRSSKQPENLSSVIRGRLRQKQRQVDTRDTIVNEYLPLAHAEDEWDRIIWKEFGIRTEWEFISIFHCEEALGQKWSMVYFQMLIDNAKMVDETLKKKEATVRRMMEIIDQEEELAEKEKEERKHLKRKERDERRRSIQEGQQAAAMTSAADD